MRPPAFLRRLPGMGRLLQALGVGGVPATGFFGAGWPLGTMLLLYWLETVLVTVLVALLIVLHRFRTGKAGHWGGRKRRAIKSSYLSEFLGVMVPFTLGHGVFVLMFALVVFPQELGEEARVSLAALGTGLTAIAVFLLAGLLFDLVGLRDRSFSWIERRATSAQGRMLITHLTIIFGAGAMAVFEAPLAFFAVFVGLKALVDLASLLPEREPRRAAPPRLLRRLEGKIPTPPGKTLTETFNEKVEEELRRREANEQPLATQPPAS